MVNDADLLGRWREGDKEAGEALFERYYDAVERFFANKVPDAVGDLVQDTFAACVAARDRVIDDDKFRSYLFSIAYNVLRRYIERKLRTSREIHLDLDHVAVSAVAPGARSLLAERREVELLMRGLRELPIAHQVLLELHYWEQLTGDDIAAVLGVPVGTVRSRLRRARALLADAVSRLARSPQELDSTLGRLDDWARECRHQLERRAE